MEWTMLKGKIDREKAGFEVKVQKIIQDTGGLEIPDIT